MMTGPGATPEDIQHLRAHYGLDRSLSAQFVIYLGQLAMGDLGTSISLRQDVGELILGRLPVTLELTVFAMLIAIGCGVCLAIVGSYWRSRWPEAIIDSVIGIIVAIPDFLWALAFILILGVVIPVMPIFGRLDLALEYQSYTEFYLIESALRGRFDVTGSVLWHMILPGVALALPLMAVGARVLKSSLNVENDARLCCAGSHKGF